MLHFIRQIIFVLFRVDRSSTMYSQQISNLHNAIRKMNTEQLLNVLELNSLSDCCDAIRSRQIDGDAFLNLTEGQLMFWRNILNRTQITRLWSVVQLAQERPQVFMQSDTIVQSPTKKYNFGTETSLKSDKKIMSPIAGSLNTILAHQLTHPEQDKFNNNRDIHQDKDLPDYDIPPRRPIISVTNNTELSYPKLPSKPGIFNPPSQIPILSTAGEQQLFKPQTEITPNLTKTGEISSEQQSQFFYEKPVRPPPPHIVLPLSKRPLPEPPKNVPILPHNPISLPPLSPNESTLHNFRPIQQKEKSPTRNFNHTQTKIDNLNQTVPIINRKLPSPIHPATRPLPAPPKDDLQPHIVTLSKANEKVLQKPPFSSNATQSTSKHEEEMNDYDYVEQTIVDFTKERWYKEVNRKRARELLAGRPDGSFIIRPNNKSPNVCSISVTYQGRIYNLAVSYKDGQLVLGKGKFDSVQEIVQHFTEIPLVLNGPNGRDIIITLRNL